MRMEQQGWKRVSTIASGSIFQRNGSFLAVYVDDGAAIGILQQLMEALWALSDILAMKDIERLNHLLGVKFARLFHQGTRMMLLHQLQYQEMLISRFQEDSPQPLREAQVPYIVVDSALEEELPGIYAPSCRKHLGGLAYLLRCTRPDLANSVYVICREVNR